MPSPEAASPADAKPSAVVTSCLPQRSAAGCSLSAPRSSARTAATPPARLPTRDLQVMMQRPDVQVGDVLLSEVVQLDAGQYHHSRLLGERVPTLAEALRTLGGKLKTIIVDVKTGPPLHEVSLAFDVLNVVRQAGCHNCLVWSKLDGVVAELKQLEPAIKAGYILMTDSRTGQAGSLLRMIEPEVVGVFHGLVTPQLVAEVHRCVHQPTAVC
eukprot:SM000018S03571  [mRNA]  locus=s18:26595:28296:- [translate_table: standard]